MEKFRTRTMFGCWLTNNPAIEHSSMFTQKSTTNTITRRSPPSQPLTLKNRRPFESASSISNIEKEHWPYVLAGDGEHSALHGEHGEAMQRRDADERAQACSAVAARANEHVRRTERVHIFECERRVRGRSLSTKVSILKFKGGVCLEWKV